jgi:malonyl-CoA O-methyltransferase
VLLHGWALHGGAWGPWIERLARRSRLHLVDLPGHGRSPWQHDLASVGDLARAVAPQVPPGAALLGWSLGGMVALELARQRPGHVAALALVATTPCFLAREDWPAGMNPQVLAGFAAGLAGDYRRTINNFLALQTWGDERAAEALRSLRANLAAHGEPDPRALEAGLRILRDADLRDGLERIALPALVIAGEHDRITPAAAGRELAAALPSARFVEVPRAGHAPFLSHPEAVLGAVESFLGFFLGPEPAQASAGVAGDDPRAAGATVTQREPSPRAAHEPAKDAYRLDPQRVRRSFSAAAPRYEASARLQRVVRDELLERLDLLRMRPARVLDLGAGLGQAARALATRYPRAEVVALDLALGMLAGAAGPGEEAPPFSRVAADAAALPLADGSVDMIVSSLMLQWCNDPDLVLRECRRVLRRGGVLHLATFGPDTLVELRRAWEAADGRHAHVSRFVDMHDLGEAMVRAGFAEPVLDVERHVLHYPDARDLMRDLKAIGAHNATAGRPHGLTGRASFARMLQAYERYRADDRLPASYEVVYAQAWAPDRAIAPRDPGGEVRVPLSNLIRDRLK